MKTIELSNGAKVDIREGMTWGQREELRATLLGGASIGAMTEAQKANVQFNATVLTEVRYKALELSIEKITEADGKEHGFTRDWMNGLTIADGDMVFDAVDEIAGISTLQASPKA